MTDTTPPSDARPDRDREAWAQVLKQHWEARAASGSRDFFVASHPGWDDKHTWESTARSSVELFLHGLDREALAQTDVLEIGCGVGRLVRPLCDSVRSYTGVDIAEGMLSEARVRCADLGQARFFVSSGVGVPEAAADRSYGLVLAVAVWIHCPREVIASLVKGGYDLLAPGGQLRFQLRADPQDATGLQAPEQAEVVHEQMEAIEQEAEAVLSEEQRALLEDVYYMGDAFHFDEVTPFLAGLTGGRVELVRLDLATITGLIERPSAGE